ncbi:unnamed protein product, partial [marine sediment metagenome]
MTREQLAQEQLRMIGMAMLFRIPIASSPSIILDPDG